MADDFKSMMNGEDLDDRAAVARVQAVPRPQMTREQASEGTCLVNDFCSNYVTRVAPRQEELDTFWEGCARLPPAALIVPLCRQLSWTTGSSEWQPRLRVLHLLEFFLGKGVLGRDIAIEVFIQSSSILAHLATEVPQCKEKSERVVDLIKTSIDECGSSSYGTPVPSDLLLPKSEAPVTTSPRSRARVKAQRKEPTQAVASQSTDLLDVHAVPAPQVQSTPAAGPSESGGVDLLDMAPQPAKRAEPLCSLLDSAVATTLKPSSGLMGLDEQLFMGGGASTASPSPRAESARLESGSACGTASGLGPFAPPVITQATMTPVASTAPLVPHAPVVPQATLTPLGPFEVSRQPISGQQGMPTMGSWDMSAGFQQEAPKPKPKVPEPAVDPFSFVSNHTGLKPT